MRRLSLALLASIGLVAGLGQVASAADLGRVYKAPPPPPVVVSVFTWTGIYVGGNVGYGWGSSNGCDVFGCIDRKPSGFLGGGQIGFNYQFARNWVVGLEADYSWSGMKDSQTYGALPPFYVDDNINQFGTVRGRIGYAWDRSLFYLTGGYAYGTTEYCTNFAGVFCVKNNHSGWTVGGGWEYAFTNNWTARAEYLYLDLGKQDFGPSNLASVETTANVVRFGVNYKFGWGGF
jgi:outer membrane immunogenic protein